jgi:transposase
LRFGVGPYCDPMKPTMFVRALTADERQLLNRGLKSSDVFTLRRSQILLASAAGKGPAQIGRVVGVTAQAVRDAIRAFHAQGTAALVKKSNAPKVPKAAWDRKRDDELKELLHRRPRELGQPTSLWTLALVAAVCHEKGWTDRTLSAEAIRLILKRLGVGWKRAKQWITSPDPEYAQKKRRGTG